MKDLIKQTRTFRKFDSQHQIEKSLLIELIDLGRLGGSARNCQPWQYLPVTGKETCDDIFPHLGWAGYLSDWKGPAVHERPTAYILCYLNTLWNKGSLQEAYFDLGIATQNMLLGSQLKSIGGCRIASFSRKLESLIPQPDHLQLHLVIAFGKPTEHVVLEESKDGDIRYFRDTSNTHHVPKRSLKEITLSSHND